eukprot:359667-Chlamydomonas_euryale.AAC.2
MGVREETNSWAKWYTLQHVNEKRSRWTGWSVGGWSAGGWSVGGWSVGGWSVGGWSVGGCVWEGAAKHCFFDLPCSAIHGVLGWLTD